MKLYLKKSFLYCTLVILLFGCEESNNPQKNSNLHKVLSVPIQQKLPKDYNVPNKLPLTTKVGLEDYFYPIGWSENGKFAWITEPADEACGCYFFSIEVMDLATNQVLWRWDTEINESELYDSTNIDYSSESWLNYVWNNNYELFKSKLLEHKIIPRIDFKLEPFPIISDHQEYNVSWFTKKNDKTDVFSEEYGSIGAFQVDITNSEFGRKTIAKKTLDFPLMDFQVSGAIKSSFGSHILVIYNETTRGYEGPPHVTSFELIGSDIHSGFSASGKATKSSGNNYLVIIGSNIWVREEPSTGEVIMKLNDGDSCVIIAKGKSEVIRGNEDFWYQIEYGNKRGWVFGSQVKVLTPFENIQSNNTESK